jgi:hypothetical protein
VVCIEARPDPEQLRALLAGMRELPPKVKRDTRRELRTVGDDIIAKQRAILDGPLPTGVAKTGQRRVLTPNARTGKFGYRNLNVYADKDVARPGRSSGMREAIKAGLKTRIVTGTTRQGIEVATSGPKVDGFNQAKFWQKVQFRHPAFGHRDRYVYQKGQPYFFHPAIEGRDDLLAKAAAILSRGVDEI